MPIKPSAPTAFPTLETGQIWEMPNSNLRIGLIGKTLVHYKHYKGTCPRASVLLTGKAALQEYLIKHKAVLAPPVPAPRATTRPRRSRVSA